VPHAWAFHGASGGESTRERGKQEQGGGGSGDYEAGSANPVAQTGAIEAQPECAGKCGAEQEERFGARIEREFAALRQDPQVDQSGVPARVPVAAGGLRREAARKPEQPDRDHRRHKVSFTLSTPLAGTMFPKRYGNGGLQNREKRDRQAKLRNAASIENCSVRAGLTSPSVFITAKK
jgi:hypothetical protein